MASKRRYSIIATLAVAATLVGSHALAGNVYWSVGIDAPLHRGVTLGTVISNGPAYRPAPVYGVAPLVAAVPYYPPYYQPYYYEPAPVYFQPRPVYVRPAPVMYAPAWGRPGRDHGHWREHRRHGHR